MTESTSECKICNLSGSGSESLRNKTLVEEYKQGQHLIQEGNSHQKDLFFLCSGEALIRKKIKEQNREIDLVKIEPGSMVGEMEFLLDCAPTASVVAGNLCKVHRLPAEVFQDLLKAGNESALQMFYLIARVLAFRLVKMDEKVIDMLGSQEKSKSLQEFSHFKNKLLKEWNF